MFRNLCVLIFLFALLAPGARASEPRLCAPQSATLDFRDGDQELAVEVRFYERNSDCTFDYERLENVRPLAIVIRLNGREFRLTTKCIRQMNFDLHGITVEFSKGRFVVWFKESHKGVPDSVERSLDAVSIWLRGGLIECRYRGEPVNF